ncbi:MAG: nuclease, partial [Acidobacteria bacterium]|nr:nuclease [Acidobacteriota bacterium]
DPGIREDVVEKEAFDRRLEKISRAIRDFMQMPDVIGVVEAENLNAVKRLASKINADAIAAGKPDPKYEAFLVEGNDGRGIDNGVLVKTSRIKVVEIKQLGKDEKYKNPLTKEEAFLNDRPPLMLRASIEDAKAGKPFEFTVIVNHLKSYSGYNDPKQMENVRLKKKLQSEFLAKLVQSRQKADPKERIVLIGDFNSYQFSDGILDQIGTIIGKPSGKDALLMPSDDLVNPDLIDLVNAIAEPQRYSFIFDGNAQVLDHMIITENMRKHTRGFGYARLNADYPESYRGDVARLERFSDHDPAVAFFTMDDMTPQK